VSKLKEKERSKPKAKNEEKFKDGSQRGRRELKKIACLLSAIKIIWGKARRRKRGNVA